MVMHETLIALTLGLIGGMIPGPVITAVFTEILQSGFKGSLRIIFVAMFVETLVAVVSLRVFSLSGLDEAVFRILSFFGALVLIWISTSLWKVRTLDTGEKVIFTNWKIVVMILSNGVLWTYWITICIPKAILLSEQIMFGDYLFMALVQIGWLISTLLMAFIFSRFRSLLSKPGIIPILFKLFALIFIYFAIDMTRHSILFFMNR